MGLAAASSSASPAPSSPMQYFVTACTTSHTRGRFTHLSRSLQTLHHKELCVCIRCIYAAWPCDTACGRSHLGRKMGDSHLQVWVRARQASGCDGGLLPPAVHARQGAASALRSRSRRHHPFRLHVLGQHILQTDGSWSLSVSALLREGLDVCCMAWSAYIKLSRQIRCMFIDKHTVPNASEVPVQAGLRTAAMPTCKARCSSTRAGSAQPVVFSRCRRAASSVGRCVLGAGLWCAVLLTLQTLNSSLQPCNMLAWCAVQTIIHGGQQKWETTCQSSLAAAAGAAWCTAPRSAPWVTPG